MSGEVPEERASAQRKLGGHFSSSGVLQQALRTRQEADAMQARSYAAGVVSADPSQGSGLGQPRLSKR